MTDFYVIGKGRLHFDFYTCQAIKNQEDALQTERRKSMPSIQTILQGIFDMAIEKAFPDVAISAIVHPSTQERFGDYQCNNAMTLSKVNFYYHAYAYPSIMMYNK